MLLEKNWKFLFLNSYILMDKINLWIIKQSFASVVWTHKIHMKCADILESKNEKMKVWNFILISLVLIGTIVQAKYPNCIWIDFINLVLAISEFILLIFTLTFNYWELAVRHKNTAEALLIIRDSYLALIWDIINGRQINVEEKRDTIKERLDFVYKFAPPQVDGAYTLATKSLWINPAIQTWDYTYSDAEIDLFLPPSLRWI